MNATFPLLRLQDQQVVYADLLPLSSDHLGQFERMWKPMLRPSGEQDSHWDWVRKHRDTSKLLSYEGYALECNQITEGLMLLECDFHRSRLEPGKNLIYVDSLATAPWNRPSIQDPPDYKGVGVALITFAIQHSIDLEYKGRVGLHSLPDAEGFYKKLKMVDFGHDEHYQNLTYFELSIEEAMKISQMRQ